MNVLQAPAGGPTVSLVTERAEVAVNPVFVVGLGLPECLHAACPAYTGPLGNLLSPFFLLRQALRQRSCFPVLREGDSTCEVYGPEPTSSGDLPALHTGVELWAGRQHWPDSVWRRLGSSSARRGMSSDCTSSSSATSWPAARRMPRARRPLWRSTSRRSALWPTAS